MKFDSLLTFGHGAKRPLVTYKMVEVQDFKEITNRFRGIYRIYLKLVKETERLHHVPGWTWKH